MRKSTLGLLAILVAVSALAQEQTITLPIRPGSAQKKLEALAGTWKYEETIGENPFGASGKGSFTAESKFILDGFFLEEKGQGTSPDGAYSWMGITAWDREKERYISYSFDSGGNFPKPWKGEFGTGTFKDNTWTWEWKQPAKGKSYSCRSTFTLAPDGKSAVYEWFYSEDGTNWKPWSKGKGTKTPPATTAK